MFPVDPFAVLGVHPDASPAEIRRAFADAVRAAHPDAGGPAATASDRLAELIQARDAALRIPGAAVPGAAVLGAGVAGAAVAAPRPTGLERLIRLVLSGLYGGRSADSDGHQR